DDRGARDNAHEQPVAEGRLVLLPAHGHVRGRGHRQPLLARRGHRRAGGGRLRRRGHRRPGARAARGLGLAEDRHGRGHFVTEEAPGRSAQRAPRRRRNGRDGPLTAAGMRTIARNRLIESRLTPNAISLTGFVLNLVAAGLVLANYFFLGGVAFIAGSLMDMFDGRYSRMSGKGTQFGAFLDSTLDRVEEGVVLAAVATYFAKHGNEVAVGAVVLAVVGSYMVSYT